MIGLDGIGEGLAEVAWPMIGGRVPRGPDGLVIYAVGDIHGRLDLLERMFGMIDADIARNPGRATQQILIGDLIDRGPDSAGVVDLAMRRQAETGLIVLRGNHEQYVVDTLREPGTLDRWLRFGGVEALASWGVEVDADGVRRPFTDIADGLSRALPDTHRRFIEELPLWRCFGDFVFVHAGLRPGVGLAEQTPLDMMMIREGFLDDDTDHGVIVVHGHTPMATAEIRRNRIGIDTKAWESDRLTCVVIDGTELRFLSTGD